jgi:hypothetical protein
LGLRHTAWACCNGGGFDRTMKDIHYEIVKDGGKIQYSHKVWCSVGYSHCQGPEYVVFLVDKLALEYVSFQVLHFCHVTVIPYTYSHPTIICSLPGFLIQVMDSAI